MYLLVYEFLGPAMFCLCNSTTESLGIKPCLILCLGFACSKLPNVGADPHTNEKFILPCRPTNNTTSIDFEV